ncbi:uncharacterized protein TRUGW13939_11022 [Talaromyces rugulosus]|uniref:DUF7053 domain-containing protein n=1 Tax=Talaromyces rugulosus TaxID=121627 RepID=A0A7H8RDR1_TALRU|nr:uncharacterized protein TRUGW13939_11022 [Talaromyces rugulosus]QKX63851.1 hypothetical protein TRUGW13939_11022 [Talaromyces rugulosus]
MMKKKEAYNNITPLPSFIPRQLVLDILHSHGEIITLNPLVLEHHAIQSPRDAPAEEYYSTWYEITERIQIVPGTGKFGSGKISFRACFHDVPWGVQTHVYAPMGIDLRHNYRVGGNQPGEPPEHRELGIGTPAQGLYLREDIEIRCNFTMTSFVRSQLKAATKVLVDRLIKKAELLDAGVLKALMDDGGRLKTVNPADRSLPARPPPPPSSSASTHREDNNNENEIVPMYSPPQYQYSPSQGGYPAEKSASSFSPVVSSSSPTAGPASSSPGKSFANELPGDTSFYHQVPLQQQQLRPPGGPNHRDSYQSTVSSNPSVGGWPSPSFSNPSRPTSYSTNSSGAYMQQPDGKYPQYAAELPTTHEEGVATGNRGLGMTHVDNNSGHGQPQDWHIPVPGSKRN